MTEERQRLFGTDLRLAGRNEALDLRRGRAGDLELAAGDENIVQALAMRLSVRKGELAPLGWPGYGSRLHELIGEPNNARTHVKLMAFAREAIEADPRVAEVLTVGARLLTGERDAVRLDIGVRLVHEPDPLNLIHDFRLEAT